MQRNKRHGSLHDSRIPAGRPADWPLQHGIESNLLTTGGKISYIVRSKKRNWNRTRGLGPVGVAGYPMISRPRSQEINSIPGTSRRDVPCILESEGGVEARQSKTL